MSLASESITTETVTAAFATVIKAAKKSAKPKVDDDDDASEEQWEQTNESRASEMSVTSKDTWQPRLRHEPRRSTVSVASSDSETVDMPMFLGRQRKIILSRRVLLRPELSSCGKIIQATPNTRSVSRHSNMGLPSLTFFSTLVQMHPGIFGDGVKVRLRHEKGDGTICSLCGCWYCFQHNWIPPLSSPYGCRYGTQIGNDDFVWRGRGTNLRLQQTLVVYLSRHVPRCLLALRRCLRAWLSAQPYVAIGLR